jgi:hypothetical protein
MAQWRYRRRITAIGRRIEADEISWAVGSKWAWLLA